MGQALAKIAADNKISSVHVNFCLADEREALEEIGFIPARASSFTGRTAILARSMIISAASEAIGATRSSASGGKSPQRGITIGAYEGEQLTQKHLRTMFRFTKVTSIDSITAGNISRRSFSTNFIDGSRAISAYARRTRRQDYRRNLQRPR